MTRETLAWLAWLVQRQVIEVGAPDAREQCQRAFSALDEIGATLANLDAKKES